MPCLFEYHIHENIFYTSNRPYSIHINRNSCIGLKCFYGLVSLQSTTFCMHNKALTFAKITNVGYVAYQMMSLCHINNPAQVYLKKTCWYNLPHSGKYVPPITKAYANVLGAQARVWTTQKLFPGSSHPKKKVVACRKIFIISKPNTTPSKERG